MLGVFGAPCLSRFVKRVMHDILRLAVGVACLGLGMMAVRALLDSSRPRLPWARTCLFILAIAALVAAAITGVEISGRGARYFRPGAHPADFWKGMTIGLFVALCFSGQWSAKAPPK